MAQNPLETPLMRQCAELKALHPEALLLFRLGDFYELFGDDAIIGSRILEITLTSRDSVIPMAGVPVRHYRSYLKTLVDADSLFAGDDS